MCAATCSVNTCVSPAGAASTNEDATHRLHKYTMVGEADNADMIASNSVWESSLPLLERFLRRLSVWRARSTTCLSDRSSASAAATASCKGVRRAIAHKRGSRKAHLNQRARQQSFQRFRNVKRRNHSTTQPCFSFYTSFSKKAPG
jgi:hypothetical protein